MNKPKFRAEAEKKLSNSVAMENLNYVL